MNTLQKLFLISFTLLFSFIAKGQIIDNELYSFKIPENWDTIPKQLLDYQTQLVNQQSGENVSYQYGIFKLDSIRQRSYPYILIQFIPLKNANKYKFEKLAEEFSKGIGKKVKELSESYSFLMDNFQSDEILVDREKERLIYIFDMKQAEFGEIRGYSVFKIVGTGFLTFHCYSYKNEFEKNILEFDSFIDNVEIKNNYEYRPSIWNSKLIDILVFTFIITISLIGLKKYQNRKKQ